MNHFNPLLRWSILLLICITFTGNSIVTHTSLTPIDLKSKVILEKVGNRYISVYLPPNFNKNTSYKVVYMLDGNAIFNIKPDLETLLNKLISKKSIEPIVLVGVHSTFNRTSDLVPYFDQDIVDYGGAYRPNAKLFSKELHEVIIPHVESQYATSKDSNDRALFGFSHGGLFSMWEISGNQKAWGMIASSSPSYWVNEYQVYKDIKEKGVSANKIWFDVGTGEWQAIYPLISILNEQELIYGRDHFYYEVKDAKHLYGHLLERIHNPLIIFAGKQGYNPVKWKIITEFIPSRSGDRVYKRINPIIELSNGVKFSASTMATYELLNENDGEVRNDGRFEFKTGKSLKVKIKYKEFEKEIVISKKQR